MSDKHNAAIEFLNSFDWIKPKLTSLECFINGRAFQQILNFLLFFINQYFCRYEIPQQQEEENEDEDEDEQEDNFLLLNNKLTKLYEKLKEYNQKYTNFQEIRMPQEINILKISKDKNQFELEKLVRIFLFAFVTGHKGSEIAQILQFYNQPKQMLILKYIGVLNSQIVSQNVSQIDIQQEEPANMLDKLSFQDEEIQKLKQDNQQLKKYYEEQLLLENQRILFLENQLSQSEEKRQDLEYQISLLLEQTGQNQLKDIPKEIEQLKAYFQVFQQNQQIEFDKLTEEYEDKLQKSKQEKEQLSKKLIKLQKLEETVEELNERIRQHENLYKEYTKNGDEQAKLKQLFDESQAKAFKFEKKFQKYQSKFLDQQSKSGQIEFELRRVQSELRSVQSQLTKKEQKIQELNSELYELEQEIERLKLVEQNRPIIQQTLKQQGISSIQNSFILPAHNEHYSRRATINQIFSIKRGLTLDIGNLNRSNSIAPEDLGSYRLMSNRFQPNKTTEVKEKIEQIDKQQSLTSQVQIQSEIQDKQIKEINDSDKESEASNQNEKNVDNYLIIIIYKAPFWKEKAELLLYQLEEKDNEILKLKNQQDMIEKNVQSALQQQEQLFGQKQQQFQSSLQNQIEEKDKQIIDLKKKIKQSEVQQQQLYLQVQKNSAEIDELNKRILKMEDNQQPVKIKQKHSQQNISTLEKQMKVQKQRYQDELNQKDEQICLAVSILLELQNSILGITYSKAEQILNAEFSSFQK